MESHRWGDYELTSVLGKGGMGIVYKGRQVSLDRPVAVKVLPKTLTARKDFVDRFYREAKSVAKINCPQIIQVFGAGEFEGKHYFAMEFVEGDDLSEKLKAGTKFENPKVLHIVREVARALAAAAEKNIIHRDIKPANIMLTRKGAVKVMDFGLAKVTTEGSELTQAGMVMGTVNYLSPEQGQGKPCDPRTDLYSLGIVMYELLTGKVPFVGDNPSSVIYQHIHTTPPLPTVLNQNIPKEVESIVLKCLQKDPNMRYFSARELIRDIESIEAGKAPKTALMDMKTLRFKKQKGKAVLIAAIIAAVLLIGGGLVWFLYPGYIKPLLAGNGRGEPTEKELQRRKELEAQKRREEEARKALASELALIEKQLKTNRLDELLKVEAQLTGLAKEHPEHAQRDSDRFTLNPQDNPGLMILFPGRFRRHGLKGGKQEHHHSGIQPEASHLIVLPRGIGPIDIPATVPLDQQKFGRVSHRSFRFLLCIYEADTPHATDLAGIAVLGKIKALNIKAAFNFRESLKEFPELGFLRFEKRERFLVNLLQQFGQIGLADIMIEAVETFG
ncbi:protein kinase [Planctomycetota bacterium]